MLIINFRIFSLILHKFLHIRIGFVHTTKFKVNFVVNLRLCLLINIHLKKLKGLEELRFFKFLIAIYKPILIVKLKILI